jgi:cell division protein FtsZ
MDDASEIIPKSKPEVKTTVENELYGTKNVKQKTFEFEIGTSVFDEFEGLYGTNPKKESHNEANKPVDYTQTSEEDVDELENIPAYRRKNLGFSGFKKKNDEINSRLSISKDENNNVFLRDNNSFLHDNVD